MAKKTSKSKGRKRTSSTTRTAAGARGKKRSAGGAKRAGSAAKRATRTARKTAGARTAKGKTGRKKAAAAARGTRKGARKTSAARSKRPAAAKKSSRASSSAKRSSARPREGGTGRESQLDQTPETGRSVKGPTNPFPTKRSTGTAAGAGGTREAPGLDRARRHLREVDETVASPPSSLDLDRTASAARTGRDEMRQARREHTEVSPDITAGDVDADWAGAYDVGDEAPGGDNPTPDQNLVEDIGRAVGVEYEDNEELKGPDKIAQRDKKRWELDPASSDDYQDRD
jgi:Family of unknown function (DUF6335)